MTSNIQPAARPAGPAATSAAEQSAGERPHSAGNALSQIAQEAIKNGRKAHQTKQYEEAIHHYSRFIEGNYGDSSMEETVLASRALCQAKLGRWPEVIADNVLLLQMKPAPKINTMINAHMAIAEAHCHQKKWNLAVLQTTYFLNTKEPPSTKHTAQAYLIRGLAHERQEHWEAADQDYTKAIVLNPEDFKQGVERARLFRGIVRAMMGNRAAALEDLRSVDFDSARAHIHPAFIPLLDSQIAKARALLGPPESSTPQTSPSKKRPIEDGAVQDTGRRRFPPY